MREVEHLDFNDVDDRSKLSQLVDRIDKDVSHIIFIIKAGKIL
jgi:formiminoglutamase